MDIDGNAITVGISIITFFGGAIFSSWKAGRDYQSSLDTMQKKIETKMDSMQQAMIIDVKARYESLEERIRQEVVEHGEKHSTIFRRIDEYKAKVEQEFLPKYVTKELWMLQNSNFEAAIRELNTSMSNNNIKMDALKDMVMKLIVLHEQTALNGNGKK